MSDYYTHRKYLKKELENLNKNIKTNCLELGTGEGSALIFEEYAKTNENVKISSYDTDFFWLNKTSEKYSLKNYIFTYINDWDSFLNKNIFEDKYDLIFIDQAPWEARIKSIDFVKD